MEYDDRSLFGKEMNGHSEWTWSICHSSESYLGGWRHSDKVHPPESDKKEIEHKHYHPSGFEGSSGFGGYD